MGKLEIQYRVLGLIGTNVYFLINKDTKETIIVDPADNADYLANQCALRGFKPAAIFLTHGHFDHIYKANELKGYINVPIYACEKETTLLADPNLNRSKIWAEAMSVKPDITVKDGERISVAGFDIKVLHTPGHTAGSCCYYIEDEAVLIAGDTLFKESYGRTDLDTGSSSSMMKSLERLFTLPPETAVYPGHGEDTTIEHELKWNPARL